MIMVTSFKRSHAHIAALSASNPTAGHHRPTPLPETPGHSQASLGQALVGSLLLSPGSCCVQGFVCAFQESVSPVLCNFWWLCAGVNGDLLQEGLCHTQVSCTQSPCPYSSPLLTRTSAGDTLQVTNELRAFVESQVGILTQCKLLNAAAGLEGWQNPLVLPELSQYTRHP